MLTEDIAALALSPRIATNLLRLSLGLLLCLGRPTITQLLVTIGDAGRDWSWAYRLFRNHYQLTERLRGRLLDRLLASMGRHRPLVVVLDGTHVPRTGKQLPGVGWAKALGSPPWKPGIQRMQRWVALSVLLPRASWGETRAIPLWVEPAPSPKATAWPGVPPRTEWEAGRDALHWLRGQVTRCGQPRRRILALADGTYAVAPLLRALPAETTLLARCAKNRALFAVPPLPRRPVRGRPRLYGPQGPSPQEQLHARAGWRTTTVRIRGRQIPLTYRVSGPWVVRTAAHQPVFVLVVKGIKRSRHGHIVRRDPTCWLVTAQRRGTRWELPFTAPRLLAWAWQRWEVEVMHRELKGGFGFGMQQATTPQSAATTLPWVAWVYGVVMLAGYQEWGWAPRARATAWAHPGRRWTSRDVLTALRQDHWAALLHAFPGGRIGIPGPHPPIPALLLPPADVADPVTYARRL